MHELEVVDVPDPEGNVPCVVRAPLRLARRSPSPNPLHLQIACALMREESPEPVPLALEVVRGLRGARHRSDAGHRTQEASLH